MVAGDDRERISLFSRALVPRGRWKGDQSDVAGCRSGHGVFHPLRLAGGSGGDHQPHGGLDRHSAVRAFLASPVRAIRIFFRGLAGGLRRLPESPDFRHTPHDPVSGGVELLRRSDPVFFARSLVRHARIHRVREIFRR